MSSGKKIASLADLNAVRARALRDVELRTSGKDVRITVHMGTCGIAAGAREILTAFMDELSLVEGHKAALQQAGCAGLCDREPMIALTDKSGALFRYVNLDRNKVRQIVAEHVLAGKPVVEFLLKD